MFTWTVLGAMSLVVFAFPILTVDARAPLRSTARSAMHFFTAGGGGNMMMYVNLIWAWGHPEVYILILPAFGVFSEVVPVFSRQKARRLHLDGLLDLGDRRSSRSSCGCTTSSRWARAPT